MPQEKIENLISQLNEEFATKKTSSAQAQLMQRLERHIHDEGTESKTEPRLADTLESMLVEFGGEHPKASYLIKETINALKNMGI